MENADTQMGTVVRPEFIRLPRTGHQCSHTGLTRSALNELILPNEANSFKPPVESYVKRRSGARTGIRLISYDSLLAHIRSGKDFIKQGGGQ